MKNLLIAMALTLSIVSCGKNDEKIEFHKADKTQFSKLINDTSLPNHPNLSIDKKIVNNSYPIEIALYNNNKFYYDLPNLGDGTGEWIYTNGRIELKARRDIFDMYIELHATDINAKKFAIKFIDRFGINKIKVTVPNSAHTVNKNY
jgi:hypothetical protein